VPDWGRGDLLGDGGPWMVFNSDAGGEQTDVPDIYGIEWVRPTTRLQFVDSDDTLDFRPRVSPDGTRILFGSDREDPSLDLWVLDLVTNELTNLTAGQGGLEMNGDWSPDGTMIAYARANATDLDVWVMNADGSEPRLLVGGPGNQDSPSWSPDGSMLVYVSDDPASHLWLVDADGSDPTQLTDGADFFPDWW
jgi:Tol biopolymer transport system component